LDFNYKSASEAAKAMLGETANLLNTMGVDYVIVGGWVPYLFHSTPLKRQETFDCDVLLNNNIKQDTIELGAAHLMKNGYLPPAKNPYQLYRVLNVDSKPTVFHLDFLHKRYSNPDHDIFIDWGPIQSIAGPGSDIILNEKEYVVHTLSYTDPSGKECTVNIKFASEIGILSTKGRCLELQKREKDAYDILLAIGQARDKNELIQKSNKYRSNRIFEKSLLNIHKQYYEGQAKNNMIASLSKNNPDITDPEKVVTTTMDEYFKAVGLSSNKNQEIKRKTSHLGSILKSNICRILK
jgi:hypothetical protein